MSRDTFENGIGYEGKITLTLKSNNRVLKTKTYKNKGTSQLFKFLGHCLMGEYKEAGPLRPSKLLLLHNYSGTAPAAATSTDIRRASEWQPLAQTPTLINDNVNQQVSVIYTFEIPKNSIERSFNQVALYGENTANNEITNFSAYYYLTDPSGREFEEEFPDSWSATTVLLIEWELALSNKDTETNT